MSRLLDEVLDLFGWAPPPPRPRPKSSAPQTPPAAPGRPAAASPRADPRPHASAPKARPEPRSVRPAPSGRSEAQTLAVIARVTPQFYKVVYTRNRRIMASAAERGRALRLNVAFAEAPDDVLVAVARLFTGRDARTRARAKAVVREFIDRIPADPSVPRRRPRARRVEPGDQPHLDRLLAEFRRVNAEKFGGSLPEVPLFLSGSMRRRNGHFCSHPLEIVISRQLCTHGAPGESELTLRHEMIHLWQHVEGKKPDHGDEFRAWARRLDVHPRATRPVQWKQRPRSG
ncbi:SprT-like domain-containing protein [Longimicrobium sp.]|uniref:SprT-like domain-containing protein n=1 Tax=Longimicrobium sp. TaxID=2029185 RepID=UPI002E300FA9|nr:SprT-like domain-containing protein [Longimicrobium sp.]HEX6039016.1 SprT-like domain-containing protein [Longimicrobium sp.]